MRMWVIDCSVVAAAYLNEPDSDRAAALLGSGDKLWAPDLITSEFGNVLWKRCSRGDISQMEAVEMIARFRRLRIYRASGSELVQEALQLALQTQRTVYDCLYLSLAVSMDTVLYTRDMRFYNSLQGGPMARHVAPISTFPLPD